MITFISEKAEKVIKEIEEYGFAEGGYNGPYHDTETPIRNSAHWIVTFSYLYRETQEEKYKETICVLAEYLYKQRMETGLYAYECRMKSGKDHVNGTIGQAWAIEGLVEATKVLKDEKYYQLAKKVFFQHEFSYDFGVWNRIEIDGKILGFDDTYNHQLWLAAAGVQILMYREDNEIRQQVLRFLDLSAQTRLFSVAANGLICHFAYIPENRKSVIRYYKRLLSNQKNIIMQNPNLSYKEEGYHYFNMYGFALIHQLFPQHKVFYGKKFKKALNYALDIKNFEKLEKHSPKNDVTGVAMKQKCSDYNVYAYGYNSPAYELPFIMKEFGIIEKNILQMLWEKQKIFLSDEEDIDRKTFSARLYEVVRAL